CNKFLSRKNLTDALVIFEKELPEFHPTTSGIYLNLGLTLEKLSKFDEALEIFEKVKTMNLIIYPKNHSFIAPCYHRVSVILRDKNLLQEALTNAEHALQSANIAQPIDYHELSCIHDTLASIHLKGGDFTRAHIEIQNSSAVRLAHCPNDLPLSQISLANVHTHENCTQQAIDLLNGINDDQLLSVHHYTPAQLSKDIAIIYNDLKQYESALRMLEFTLQHIADDEHYLGAGAHLLVANIYWKLGHKSQTLEHLDQALVMLDNMNKEYYHEMIICIFKSMANVHKASNEYRQVLECYQKLLSFCKTNELAQIHIDIGFCYSELNEMGLSLESYQLARSLCSSTNYELLANIYDGLGKYYAHSGNSIEAINNFETTLNIRLLYMKNDDFRLTSLYADLGQLYLESEKYQEAANFFEQLLDKQMKQNEQENAINTLVLLGITQVRQNNLDKGIYYYKMAFQLSLSMSSPDYKIAAFICSHMGEAYDLDCNPWQCVESYEKAIEMARRVEPHDDELLALFHENAQVARQSVIKAESKIIEAEDATTTTEHD
ncbi:unnamed protein product, partial [Rotaria sp. Silwood2]